jgi:tetratricopeptide (TPR) repeat protein
VSSLTDIHKTVATNGPSRLTALASVRAAYWNQALEIFQAHPAAGVGARGYETAQLRYREGTLEAKNAHGYIVQTLADLGLVGLAITLALLAAWLAAAGRSTRPFDLHVRGLSLRGERHPYTAERIGMLAMLCLVVVFGVHSFVDWTWYVPGNACVALLCAGWLAGRGPLWASSAADAQTVVLPGGHRTLGATRPRRLTGADLRSPRAAVAVCVLAAAALTAWAQSQPQSSVDAFNQALDLLAANKPVAARTAAERAVAKDPLSAEALFALAEVQQGSGQRALARSTLQRAVRLQPSNPQTWLTLGRFDLTSNPRAALNELRAAIYLNPEAIAPSLIQQGNPEAVDIQNDFVLALRGAGKAPQTVVKQARPALTQAPSLATPGRRGAQTPLGSPRAGSGTASRTRR